MLSNTVWPRKWGCRLHKAHMSRLSRPDPSFLPLARRKQLDRERTIHSFWYRYSNSKHLSKQPRTQTRLLLLPSTDGCKRSMALQSRPTIAVEVERIRKAQRHSLCENLPSCEFIQNVNQRFKWEDVRDALVLKSKSTEINSKEVLGNLVLKATHILRYQWHRRFFIGIIVAGTDICIVLLSREGVFLGINSSEERLQFITQDSLLRRSQNSRQQEKHYKESLIGPWVKNHMSIVLNRVSPINGGLIRASYFNNLSKFRRCHQWKLRMRNRETVFLLEMTNWRYSLGIYQVQGDVEIAYRPFRWTVTPYIPKTLLKETNLSRYLRSWRVCIPL